MGVIAGVDPGSIAEALGIEAGDRLLAIDGKPVSDVIDYQVHVRGGRFPRGSGET